ncbi:phosphonoacetaldehyde hydrolase [Variovorax saccharolyticus]|uniref:phosphonoacetaldehyde hydrolase n=1 Tax=Variovorax saccharolyticus TaxID=3053516 RepID=UPI0025789285|nr:phosphonoacetaldehyde hydrolase [Variovorax sp. J22R187]MDM0019018.1 phosphonoacetaldehyde hydrolase [Variovorax sp. J22R187]
MNESSAPAALSSHRLQAVIFDWAGTLVDFGSLAPTQIFVDAFASFGIQISLAQARGPMGLSKRDHIRSLLDEPAIGAQWQQRFGVPPGPNDIDALYQRFMPMQIEKVGDYSQPIPGVVDTLAWLRAQGLKIGSCSGYPRQVLDVLLPLAARAGIVPDHVVAGDELAAGGRPGPYMALANVLALQVSDVRACVKVDDTVPGIEEGRNAGMWCVGVTLSGNEVGLTEAALSQLTPAEVQSLRRDAERRLRAAGAHLVIDSVADLPLAIQEIVRLQDAQAATA